MVVICMEVQKAAVQQEHHVNTENKNVKKNMYDDDQIRLISYLDFSKFVLNVV